MARVKAVYKQSDYPGTPDEATRKDLQELFDHILSRSKRAEIDGPHSGLAVAAQNPRLALHLARLSEFIVLQMPWCKRRDLLELAIQVLNLHFKCDFSFQARLPHAQAAGITLEQQAAIPFWRTVNVFNEEQRLVIEYTLAVVAGDVPDELSSKVVRKYGEKGAVEFTTAVGWFSLWAMLINATRPEFDFGYSKAAAAK